MYSINIITFNMTDWYSVAVDYFFGHLVPVGQRVSRTNCIGCKQCKCRNNYRDFAYMEFVYFFCLPVFFGELDESCVYYTGAVK